VLHITSHRVLIGLSIGALLVMAFASIRAVSPTYGSDVDGTWTISVVPEHPRVGDVIEVRARANETQSPTILNLQIEQDEDHPVVELIDNPFGYGAIITFDAIGPGTATIRGTGFFEKTVCPTPDSDFCFPYGFYLTTPDIVIEVAPSSCGDANGDGRVNSIDAFLLLMYKAGIILPSPYPYSGDSGDSDVDGNGIVNAIDATIILQFHAALLPPGALHCPPPITP
jgi:hypothetical protein